MTCCARAAWQGVHSSKDYGHFLPSGVGDILPISCSLLGQASDSVPTWGRVGGLEVEWLSPHSKKVLPWFFVWKASAHSQRPRLSQSRNTSFSVRFSIHPQQAHVVQPAELFWKYVFWKSQAYFVMCMWGNRCFQKQPINQSNLCLLRPEHSYLQLCL